MKRIALLLPQFGKVPNYFDLWLISAKHNPTIDFYIISDIDFAEYSVPSNVEIISTNFRKMVDAISNSINFKVYIKDPYKLCDYKPAYGIVFKDILSGYDFWGHIDPDVIMGDLRKFLTEEVLNRYSKIYTRGHLTIYANDLEANNYYRINHDYHDCLKFEDVTRTSVVCGYDEWGFPFVHGISEILKRKGVMQYDSIDFADINPFNFRFNLEGRGEEVNYLYWKNGRVFSDNGDEFSYIHLQKRSMIEINNMKNRNIFFIYPDRILLNKDSKYYQNIDLSNKQKGKKILKYKNKIKKIGFRYFLFRLKVLFRKKGLI